jgi:two-component system cell cycle sensor histidine kinase/response regulator CckA
VSSPAEALLGRPAAAWLEPGFWRDAIHPADYEWVVRLREQAREKGEPYVCDFRMRHANTTIVWVREHGRPAGGADTGMSGFTVAIGDVKRQEEELLHSRKLETLGRLIGGVAHDFTNLAMALTGYSDVVVLQLDAAHPARPFAEELKVASQGAVNLLRQLLAFTRKREIQPTLLDLNESVTTMVKLLRKVLGDNVAVATVLDPELGFVRMDPGQTDQVLMNLAVNARDAMPEGGNLTLETGTLAATAEGRRGPWVALRVRDTGTGMSEETRARIFEPFFTTKGPHQGTGLGLSLVREIVDRAGGIIRVESTPGKGTLFEILLPRLEGEIARLPPGGVSVPGGTETLLFVDDDATVRRLFAHGLTQLGYRVIQAATAPEALDAVQSQDSPVALVVTDLIMADMSGMDLASLLRATHPGIRALYIMGYTHAPDGASHLQDFGPILEKPFRLEQLARQIRRVLDPPGAAGDPSVTP